MSYLIDSTSYQDLLDKVYRLIKEEISNPKDIEAQYPKFVIMYEFFTLLRGEAFSDLREPLGEENTKIQQMEDEIFSMLGEMKSKIQDSEKAKFHYENMVSSGLKL